MEPNCPYRGLPDRAVWRQCVGRRAIETILPLDDSTLPIAPTVVRRWREVAGRTVLVAP